ncbi:neuronal acetylcholine receptor subunit alpha-3 [Plakobranchus ocellatus]|uniref:Neuronal acetylcholine receptor subunit alpha-3 n=1 Tax=Plakobranchus ocellatus TaxID=259542 RepID=A0AAV3ZS52_9GAST|nr:neuronal acetylcholine receptor subunit alpha-3 [Plakobranchus ocellatus]
MATLLGQRSSCTASPLRTFFVPPLVQHATAWLCLTLYLLIVCVPMPCQGGNYSHTKSIHDTLLPSSNYNPDIRPLVNQEDILKVGVAFELVSIVEINDVVQRFMCNGFLFLSWMDEILRWDPASLNGVDFITPKPKHIFRPRMVLLNTLGERDLFEDDYAMTFILRPVNVYSDGYTTWVPGSIFPASCKLDLTKYPFDKQNCQIQMVVMSYSEKEILFHAFKDKAHFTFFTQNGEWDVAKSHVTTPTISVDGENLTSVVITFQLERKPVFLMICMILPIVFLSLLNLLVFVIPVDSGEKISYGITVLLALTVFMSTMSSMLPRSSETMPLIISYIFCLMVISVLTVVVSIAIVKIHHMEEKEERSLKAQEDHRWDVPKISVTHREMPDLEKSVTLPGNNGRGIRHKNDNPVDQKAVNYTDGLKKSVPSSSRSRMKDVKVNRYKIIGKYIDMASLILFGMTWVAVTVGFVFAIGG